jgi:hypothetical protein
VGPNQKVTIPLNLSVNAIALVKDIASLVAGHKSVAYVCEGGVNAAGDLEGLKPLNVPFNFTGTKKF